MDSPRLLVRWVPVAPDPVARRSHRRQCCLGSFALDPHVGRSDAQQIGHVVLTIHEPRKEGSGQFHLRAGRSRQAWFSRGYVTSQRLKPSNQRAHGCCKRECSRIRGERDSRCEVRSRPSPPRQSEQPNRRCRRVPTGHGRGIPRPLRSAKLDGHSRVPSVDVTPPAVSAARGHICADSTQNGMPSTFAAHAREMGHPEWSPWTPTRRVRWLPTTCNAAAEHSRRWADVRSTWRCLMSWALRGLAQRRLDARLSAHDPVCEPLLSLAAR